MTDNALTIAPKTSVFYSVIDVCQAVFNGAYTTIDIRDVTDWSADQAQNALWIARHIGAIVHVGREGFQNVYELTDGGQEVLVRGISKVRELATESYFGQEILQGNGLNAQLKGRDVPSQQYREALVANMERWTRFIHGEDLGYNREAYGLRHEPEDEDRGTAVCDQCFMVYWAQSGCDCQDF